MTHKDLMIDIFFENTDFVVVDKPADLNFHSEITPGLVVLVQQQLALEALYPVHRLDKMTSGLVVLAKTKAAAQAFGALFSHHHIEKYYLALSLAQPKKKQGWVKGDLLPARNGSWRLAKTQHNPAITQFISQSIGPKQRAFLVKLHTGKTHQIRVALKSLAAPIAGDSRYAEKGSARLEMRGYLHAYALKFCLFGQDYQFVLPPKEGGRFVAENFQTVLSAWAKPWQCFDQKKG